MAHQTSSPLFRLLTPLLRTLQAPKTRLAPTCPTLGNTTLPNTTLITSPAARKTFSSSAAQNARPSKKAPKKDPRITLIRYHLQHPSTPRPLRFSRMRSLRHWTIHRAWQLFRRKQRTEEQLELERMWNSMRESMEALRVVEGRGGDADAIGGRLYRIAGEKKGVWGKGGVPIEYARHLTDTPGKEAWNHGWTR